MSWKLKASKKQRKGRSCHAVFLVICRLSLSDLLGVLLKLLKCRDLFVFKTLLSEIPRAYLILLWNCGFFFHEILGGKDAGDSLKAAVTSRHEQQQE